MRHARLASVLDQPVFARATAPGRAALFVAGGGGPASGFVRGAAGASARAADERAGPTLHPMPTPSSSSLLAAYLHAVAAIRATGAATPETSYYTPLENLLNAVGGSLKPAVRAVSQLADLGAGRPDFGLFSAGLFERPAAGAAPERVPNQAPDRGAGEVKGPAESLAPLLAGKQVSKYWARYKQVLVTNLR